MTLSIWPHDTALEPDQPLKPFGHLTCFVASPFQPTNRFDDLFELVKEVCEQLRAGLQLDQFECVRSDVIASAGVIHPEIWHYLKRADVIVADVSGQNGNVLVELGVAAAWRRKEQVIILREENTDERHLFDINPARHIEYTRTSSGFALLRKKLAAVMSDAIVAAPFADVPIGIPELPLIAKLDDGRDSSDLWVPPVSHRRMLADCLEFGSLYQFSRSWLVLGGSKPAKVKVRAELRFTERRETSVDRCWMGINLRAQLFYANLGHLVLLRSDGTVVRTARDEDGSHHDVPLGRIDPYNPEDFVQFQVSLDDTAWEIQVGTVKTRVPLTEMSFIFAAGRVLVQTFFAAWVFGTSKCCRFSFWARRGSSSHGASPLFSKVLLAHLTDVMFPS